MSGMWFSGPKFTGTISELLGFKSGLAVSDKRISALLKKRPDFKKIWDQRKNPILRIEPTEFEEFVHWLFYSLGSVDSPIRIEPTIEMFHKFKNDPVMSNIYHDISKSFVGLMNRFYDVDIVSNPSANFPVEELASIANRSHGKTGILIAMELLQKTIQYVNYSPWSNFRDIEWKDRKELDDLFVGESLQTFHGDYFDQRFIDYLDRNFADLSKVNWRKFEGLTAEFFSRIGCTVALGPGRSDGGIDIRVWTDSNAEGEPPTMLVQCKRYKEKIDQVVIKALWADVVAERAKSGLVVTTSSIAPAAKRVCSARAYPIQEANRETLRKWIQAMRTPSAGIFLSQ